MTNEKEKEPKLGELPYDADFGLFFEREKNRSVLKATDHQYIYSEPYADFFRVVMEMETVGQMALEQPGYPPFFLDALLRNERRREAKLSGVQWKWFFQCFDKAGIPPQFFGICEGMSIELISALKTQDQFLKLFEKSRKGLPGAEQRPARVFGEAKHTARAHKSAKPGPVRE